MPGGRPTKLVFGEIGQVERFCRFVTTPAISGLLLCWLRRRKQQPCQLHTEGRECGSGHHSQSHFLVQQSVGANDRSFLFQSLSPDFSPPRLMGSIFHTPTSTGAPASIHRALHGSACRLLLAASKGAPDLQVAVTLDLRLARRLADFQARKRLVLGKPTWIGSWQGTTEKTQRSFKGGSTS